MQKALDDFQIFNTKKNWQKPINRRRQLLIVILAEEEVSKAKTPPKNIKAKTSINIEMTNFFSSFEFIFCILE